jgi:hypothetical protein
MKDCWGNKNSKNMNSKNMHMKRKYDDKGKGKERAKKKAKTEETSHVEEVEMDEEITFSLKECMVFDATEEGQHFNIQEYDSCNMNGIDEHILYYDWLADSATTSHVTNQREAFITYQPLEATTVAGVGNIKAKAEGRGTIEIVSYCDGHKYILTLEDVLYIPNNCNNLISLGRWDTAGGRYVGGRGTITLITKDGKSIAKGTKISNNLYKMKVSVREPNATHTKKYTATPQTFMSNEPSQSWETWHNRFGHISYSGLQKLLDLKLVDGFTVDTRTPKTDCVACTEAKQSQKPFSKSTDRTTAPGELTHIDLWGKYDVTSINGNQYYIVLVDDAARYTTIDFLKKKDEVAQKVIKYLLHLKTHGKCPKAIRMDRGKEFINETLKTWCHENGINIQMTVPYSPSQNGWWSE